jgi:hypothetical protein
MARDYMPATAVIFWDGLGPDELGGVMERVTGIEPALSAWESEAGHARPIVARSGLCTGTARE